MYKNGGVWHPLECGGKTEGEAKGGSGKPGESGGPRTRLSVGCLKARSNLRGAV